MQVRSAALAFGTTEIPSDEHKKTKQNKNIQIHHFYITSTSYELKSGLVKMKSS